LIVIDDPDACGRARQTVEDLRDLRRARRVDGRALRSAVLGRALRRQRLEPRGWRFEQRSPVVQGGRHRLRRTGERALLGVAQETLELLHVLVAEPRDREEYGQDKQELRANAEGDARTPGRSRL